MKRLLKPGFLWAAVFSILMMIACDITPAPDPDDSALSGNITMNNGPVAGVTVSITAQTGGYSLTKTTDTQGVYSISTLAEGSYRLVPSKAGLSFSPESSAISISEEGDVTGSLNFFATQVNANEEIKVILTGDINLGYKVGEVVQELQNGDYTFPFQCLGAYLREADLTIGNLESIISDKGANTKDNYGVPLRAHPDAVDGLNFAGFDIVSVANNHIGDFDFEGMLDSFERLTDAGIDYVGGGNTFNEAHAPVIKNINGTKIAVLAYSNVPMYMDVTGPYSPTPKWIAREDRPGLAWAHNTRFEMYGDLAQMSEDIANANALADIVIVTVHFGWEYHYEPDDAQKELARTAIDAGASLVIGHHPHVQQPVEVYKGKFIAYSLGNFIFDISENMAEGTTKGMVIEAYISNGQITKVSQVFTKINEFYQVELDE